MVRDGEESAPHVAPVNRVKLPTLIRYVPGLSGRNPLYWPLLLVDSLPSVFQPPDFLTCSITGTVLAQSSNPSVTLTVPRACSPLSRNDTVLRCSAPAPVTVKFVALVPVPARFVTVILPVVAPVGTVAVIWVAELTVNVAATLLNLTAVVPVKFVPVIVTTVPTGPLVGVNDVIVGAPAATVKFVVAAPVEQETSTGPVTVPDGTVAVICVPVAFVVPFTVRFEENVTGHVVESGKFVPVIVTAVPTGPLGGLIPVMVRAHVAWTRKLKGPLAVPPPPAAAVLETEIGTDPDGPAGTGTVIEVFVTVVGVAFTPPKRT